MNKKYNYIVPLGENAMSEPAGVDREYSAPKNLAQTLPRHTCHIKFMD
jgi:hypothetical protein